MKTTNLNLPADVRRQPSRRGFTLLEVLVSIALVLLIILGVNQVFALTSQAVGAGNALSLQVRDSRSAQSIITADLSNAELDRAPFFWLHSEVLLGFRNREDQFSDADYSATSTTRSQVETSLLTVDRDRNGRESDADDLTPRAILTSRTHRADVLKFFTRQTGRRQTGNVNTFTSGVSSSEQYVTYGHLRQPSIPDNFTSGRLPGIGPAGTVLQPTGSNAAGSDNPNNFYATQWILGRVAFLLREPELAGAAKVIRDQTQSGAPAQTYYGRSAADTTLRPFNIDSPTTADGGSFNSAERIQDSLYDLIGIGMERFRTDVLKNYALTNLSWHDELFFRQEGFPAPSRPLTSHGIARTVPCFVPACTQFVVEYAGDFVTQDDTGVVTAVANGTGGGTDGIVDFDVVTTNGVTRRNIRWYGFPRDVNGDGKILPKTDVVPIRDFLSGPMPFERIVLPRYTDNDLGYGATAAVATNAQYRVVWGPDTAGFPSPRMIRIVMATDDPAGRLANEQFSEFIVQLPQ